MTLFRLILPLWMCASAFPAGGLRIATFQVDATPPLGSPLCLGLVDPAKQVVDPLSARGIVLFGQGQPIVLVAVDWVGISNSGWDEWRSAVAQAAGTTADRVTVHTLHQHDAPGYDPDAERLLAAANLSGRLFAPPFMKEVIARAASAVREAVKHPRAITHVAVGKAQVDRVASNRRVLGGDGKVKYVRYSATKIPEARAEPEGTVDPFVRLISFWDGERPVAVMTYYTTHPQSYYGKGGVSSDFVGMARSIREKEMPGVFHVHFNGASGNVTAGKYNDGSPENRPALAERLAAGMRAAWKSAAKSPVQAEQVAWRTQAVTLPLAEGLRDSAGLRATIQDASASLVARNTAARNLAWVERQSKVPAALSLLTVGPARVVGMPGELFVEYQLAAQQMRPKDFIAMAAYADFGPGYIGTAIAYTQGGYETGPVSRTSPDVEPVLMNSMRKLLQ